MAKDDPHFLTNVEGNSYFGTMKLLKEEELILSAVVANNRMNRGRNASGVNSYEKDLGFQPVQYIRDRLARFGQVKWLDLCCGEGKALLQCAVDLADKPLQHWVLKLQRMSCRTT